MYTLYLQVPFLEPKRTGQILTRRQVNVNQHSCSDASARRAAAAARH